MRVMLLPLEIQHRVDDVLERLRAGEAAVLGDVADQERRDVLPLAANSSCVADSRTWPMLPGADWNFSENTVCIESTITNAGRSRAISSRIRSRQVSARM